MSIDFKLQDYSFPLSTFKLRKFFERSQYFSSEEMEAYQQSRLKAVLGHAARNVPFYTKLFREQGIDPAEVSNLSAIRSIPLLTKKTLSENFELLQANNASRFKPQENRTSGSTGNPYRFLSDKFSRTLEFAFYWRHWSWAGYKLGNRFAELSSHFFVKSSKKKDLIYSASPLTGRILLNSLKISPDSMDSFVKVFRRYRPKFLKGVASALYFLAYWLSQKHTGSLSFQAVFSTGETLSPQYRNLIESVFSCKVLDTYGHMERTVAVSQCLEGGYHVNSDYGLFELGDSRPSESSGHSIRSVVGTSLYNMAMPLIRYEVGDLIEPHPDPFECPCGRKLPLIKAIHGRHEDVIITPEGRFIASIYIALNLVKGFFFGQFIQEKKDRLQVNLIKDLDFEDKDEQEFLEILTNFTGAGMKIKIQYVTAEQIFHDPTGKIPIVKSFLKPE